MHAAQTVKFHPHKHAKNQHSIAKATEITKAYSVDREAARKHYPFEQLIVEGVVKAIQIDAEGEVTVTLAGHNENAEITCNTFKNNSMVKDKVKVGQVIKVKGLWYGYSNSWEYFLLGYSELID